jgi:hypothetical protein
MSPCRLRGFDGVILILSKRSRDDVFLALSVPTSWMPMGLASSTFVTRRRQG